MAPHRAFEVVRIPSMSSLRNGGTESAAGSVVIVVGMHVALATDAPVASSVRATEVALRELTIHQLATTCPSRSRPPQRDISRRAPHVSPASGLLAGLGPRARCTTLARSECVDDPGRPHLRATAPHVRDSRRLHDFCSRPDVARARRDPDGQRSAIVEIRRRSVRDGADRERLVAGEEGHRDLAARRGMVAVSWDAETNSGQGAVHVIVGVAPVGYSAVMSAASAIANDSRSAGGGGIARLLTTTRRDATRTAGVARRARTGPGRRSAGRLAMDSTAQRVPRTARITYRALQPGRARPWRCSSRL